MENHEESQGRALLQCAVFAIQDGRWNDLTCLLQSHSSALQAARLRLEKKTLEQHASRAAKTNVTSAETHLKPAIASLPTAKASAGSKAQEHVTKVLPSPRSGTIFQNSVGTASRWADHAPWLALLAVQFVVIISFLPAFMYQGFTMDDAVAIERNMNVVGEHTSLTEFMRLDYWGLPMHGSGWTTKSFRPFTTLTFRWNFLLHGLHSSGFHVTNILLHCLSSILVGRTAITTLGLPGSWAAVAALFFGVHPVHTENVLYLVGRADILAAIFGLAALNMYSMCFRRPALLQQRNAHEASPEQQKNLGFRLFGLVFPVLFVITSGLCKETGFMLFALFLLMELLDFLEMHAKFKCTGRSIPARIWRHTCIRVSLLAATTVIVLIARYRHTGGTSLNMSPQDNPISFETSLAVRMLSYAYLQGYYARLLCWPQFLCYDYSMDAIPMVRTAFDCRLLLPIAAYVGIAAAITTALRAPRKYRRATLVSLGLLVVPYLPASNILFPVGTVIGERLLYIPSCGFCLAVLVGLHRVFGQKIDFDDGADISNGRHGSHLGSREASRHRSKTAISNGTSDIIQSTCGAQPPKHTRHIFIMRATLMTLAVRTLLRVRVWESPETLFIHDGHAQPTSSKTQFNLGITYMQRQEWDAAVAALVRCAYADPLSSLPFYRIGQIEILRGNFQTAEHWLSAALDKFGASLMVRDEEVFHDLAVAMFQNGKKDAAEMRLKVALQLNPDFAKGWNNLACCIISHNMHDAIRAVRKAVSLAPDNPQYWANLALLARHTGDPATASSAWRQASELWPSMPEPRDCTWEFIPAG